MASRIAAHIERGLDLKRQYVELVYAWQYDPKTDHFPDFITGEPHAIGDLEIAVERWLNESEILARGLLNSDDTKRNLSHAQYALRAPWYSSWSQKPTRS